jgi:hypothetical protein
MVYMAELLGPRKRGRKKEALRLACEAIAATVKATAGEKSVTVEVAPAEGKRKAEVVTFSIPKGAALIPMELTLPKKDENVREQMRLGASDAGKALSVRSTGVKLDNGDVVTIWHYEAK